MLLMQHMDHLSPADSECGAVGNGSGRSQTQPGQLSPSVSVGGALIEAEDTVEDLLRRADERLYRSKTEGRSRATAA